MGGFLSNKEVLTRERVKEILRNKEYNSFEEKVNLLEVRDDSLLLKVSFLIEHRTRMIVIEEKDPSSCRLAISKSRIGATASKRSPISNERLWFASLED